MVASILVSDIGKPTDTEFKVDDNDYYVFGINVEPKVYHFANALAKDRSFRQVQFGIKKDTHLGSKYSQLWVYYPDEIYARGKIGYGDIGVNEYIVKYYVAAESIENRKIATYNRQHKMLATDNISRAVRNAKMHLRALSPKQVQEATISPLCDALNRARYGAQADLSEKASSVKDNLTPSGTLTAEFRHMVKTGYAFTDKTLEQEVMNYLNALDESQQTTRRRVFITLVLVHAPEFDGAENRVMVKRAVTSVNLQTSIGKYDIERAMEGSVEHEYVASEVPDEIRGKVSALSIVEEGHYVDGLGYRRSDNIFYLAEDA